MIVTTLDPPSIRDLAAALLPTAPRATGVHVSEVIKQQLLAIDPARYGQAFEATQRDNLWHTGYIWEEIIARIFADGRTPSATLYKGHELFCDGLYGTPDWFEVVTHPDNGREELFVSETKATWKSSREFVADPEAALWDVRFVGWLMQLRAYCHMLGLDRARLHILFMNDDYEKYLPAMRSFQIIFTTRELDENWSMLQRTARKLGWL